MSLAAGAARMEIDVPSGTDMAGFAARNGPSEGVHDPLSVRALVLDDLALVAVDVCALHERTVETIQNLLDGVVASSVITATHTHSGPCVTFERLGTHATAVHDAIVAGVVAAVRDAASRRQPCTVRYGETPGMGIAKNRRHDGRDDDPPAQFLRFESDAETVAWLVVYPCHPVVLDATNRLISGDYPASLRSWLEDAAPGSTCVFATGAAGDMNNGHRVEASYEADTSGTRTFAEADRIGKALAEAVASAPTAPAGAVGVRVTVKAVELPIERVGREQARAERATWQAEAAGEVSPQRRGLLDAWIAWATGVLTGIYDQIPDTWPATVTAAALGDVTIVALPGEPFLATADRIAAVDDAPVLVLGYANGCPGYLPPADEYAHGGYEVVDAHRYYAMPGPFAPGAAELLEAAAISAMTEARS